MHHTDSIVPRTFSAYVLYKLIIESNRIESFVCIFSCARLRQVQQLIRGDEEDSVKPDAIICILGTKYLWRISLPAQLHHLLIIFCRSLKSVKLQCVRFTSPPLSSPSLPFLAHSFLSVPFPTMKHLPQIQLDGLEELFGVRAEPQLLMHFCGIMSPGNASGDQIFLVTFICRRREALISQLKCYRSAMLKKTACECVRFKALKMRLNSDAWVAR